MSDEEWRAFVVARPRPAVLATVRADGRPHAAPVWIDVDDGAVWFNTGAETVKGRNLARAGVYAVRLRDAGYLPDERVIYCPAVIRDADALPVLPASGALQSADPAEAETMFAAMDGAYGYALGYVDEGRYRPLRNLDRSTFAVLADSPQEHGGGGRNHGCGQNVWFEDGHAEFLNCCRLSVRDDDLYENDDGFVGAGIGPDDVVIGAATASPLLMPVGLDESP